MRSKKERKKEPSKGEDSYCHAQQWPSKQVLATIQDGLSHTTGTPTITEVPERGICEVLDMSISA